MMYNSEVLSVWIKRRRYAYGLVELYNHYFPNIIKNKVVTINATNNIIKIYLELPDMEQRFQAINTSFL